VYRKHLVCDSEQSSKQEVYCTLFNIYFGADMSRIIALSISVLFLTSCGDPRTYFEDRSTRRTTTLKDDPGFAQKDSGMIKITPLDEPTPFPTVAPSLRPSLNVATVFSGDIAGADGKQKFYRFLEKNDQKQIKLDLLLSDDQVAQVNDVDRGKTWYFDLGFQDKDGFTTGGEMMIDVAKNKGDLRLNGNHLTGNIRVIDWSGPRQGLMSITAKPAASSNTITNTFPGLSVPPIAVPRSTPSTRPRAVNKEIKPSDNNPPI
jgi:hypothetical protein